MTRPRIAAVIPLYNGAKYIERAMLSVFEQTVVPNEIIVVDDGSTDDGPYIASKFPVTVLSKANAGQSSARNLGVARATTDLIAFLDQDDVWYHHHLELLLAPFMGPSQGAPLGWVYSDLDEIDGDGHMVCQSFLAHRGHGAPHPKRDIYNFIQREVYIIPSASLISRDAFNAVGGFDERLSGYEDDDLFLRLFRAGYGNEFIQTPTTQWRLYAASASYTERMRHSREIYCRKLLMAFPDEPTRRIFHTRDVILPRFYQQALFEHIQAVRSHDAKNIAETRLELQFMCAQMPRTATWTGRLFLFSPRLVEMAVKLRNLKRRVISVVRQLI